MLILIASFLLLPIAAAERQPELDLMPVPLSIQYGDGRLTIDRSFSVAVAGFEDTSLEHGVQRFVAELSKQTGILFKQKPGESASPTLLVRAEHGRELVQRVGEDESYELAINGVNASLTAPTPLGILHGLQTFLQLVTTTADGFAVPSVTVKDRPRFSWRGLLIDPARHFIPIDVLKRNIDGMEAVKMNVLHLHLTDNEGFRVESKRFPKLHQMGSDGLYYTQDQVRELVAYARDRGIRVVPEFEMPGHSGSWYVGYPELASGRGPYQLDSSGIEPVMDVTREAT